MNIASEYISHGLALIDIPLGKKGPIAKNWNLIENVVLDAKEAARLVNNIGLAHAYSSPTPTMALDIDNMELARSWLAENGIDLAELLGAGDAVQIVSGKPGRAKLLYRLPEGHSSVESITVKKKVNIDNKEQNITVLEFRCATRDGLTVQDVLPPSLHPDTSQPYEWGGKGDWRNLPEIPAPLLDIWIIELVCRAKKQGNHNRNIWMDTCVEDTPRQRARMTELLAYINADCPYEIYRDIVWAILSTGWDDAYDIAAMWCQTAPERYEEDNFIKLANSYDCTRTPTIGTIIYHARMGGWDG